MTATITLQDAEALAAGGGGGPAIDPDEFVKSEKGKANNLTLAGITKFELSTDIIDNPSWVVVPAVEIDKMKSTFNNHAEFEYLVDFNQADLVNFTSTDI